MENELKKIHDFYIEVYGADRGSVSFVAKEVGASVGLVGDWKHGRKKPGPDFVKKLSERFGKSVEEIKGIFDIKNTVLRGRVKKSNDAPESTLGFLIAEGKIKFSDKKGIPDKENQLMSRYLIEIDEDAAVPADLKGVQEVEIHVVDSIGKNEGQYFVVELKGKHLLRRCNSRGKKILLTWGKEEHSAAFPDIKVKGIVTKFIHLTNVVLE